MDYRVALDTSISKKSQTLFETLIHTLLQFDFLLCLRYLCILCSKREGLVTAKPGRATLKPCSLVNRSFRNSV